MYPTVHNSELRIIARKGEDAGVPATAAVDPGETMLRVAAFEEPPDDVLLDAAPEPAARPQFRSMPDDALVQSRRARFARSEYPSRGGLCRMHALLHASSNAVLSPRGTACAANAARICKQT